MADKKQRKHNVEEFQELVTLLTPEEFMVVYRLIEGLAKKNQAEAAKNAKPAVKMFTLTELKPILAVTYRTLQNWVKSGYLPVVRIGKKWMISEDDLLKFVLEKRMPGTKKAAKTGDE